MVNKELENLMSITVENLAKNQHSALKKHVLDTLDTVKRYIEEEKYEEVEQDLTFHSGQGDGWGDAMDSYVINFDYTGRDKKDITDVVCELINLKKAMLLK